MSVFRAGMIIRFKRTLQGIPTGDHPGFIYCVKGERGRIIQEGGCWEGFWVKGDVWPWAAFGCEAKDFECA